MTTTTTLPEPIPCTPEEADTERHQMIVRKIMDDPSILSIPLDNIDRWLAAGQFSSPHRLEQWRQLILAAQASPQGMSRLLSLLLDRGEDAKFFRGFSPFAGMLTRAERQYLIKRCVHRH